MSKLTNKEKLMSKVLIHGENIFKPVTKIPEGEISSHKLFIAGHSETGHHHIVESDQEFEVTTDPLHNIYLQVFGEAKVTHKKSFDKHETLTLEPGMYQVYRAQEYDPFAKVMRDIWD